ncbi:MAG: hypothetical protein QNJ55_32375 [Xenococcus sp. MO_188.B8]|nr:hypothetical protein [Xenococcus sp. MO_188.B8]
MNFTEGRSPCCRKLTGFALALFFHRAIAFSPEYIHKGDRFLANFYGRAIAFSQDFTQK